MNSQYSREVCVRLLVEKNDWLKRIGENRYPCRSDFTDEEVVAIKAFLGPWPRALEAAGLKPCRNDEHHRKNIEKRIRAKRHRAEYER